jgi:hypothetical protein
MKSIRKYLRRKIGNPAIFIMKLPKISNGLKVFLFWLAIFAGLALLKIFVFPG